MKPAKPILHQSLIPSASQLCQYHIINWKSVKRKKGVPMPVFVMGSGGGPILKMLSLSLQ